MRRLDSGDVLPSITITPVEGGPLTLPDPRYLQSKGFVRVLGPDGRAIVSVYSSGAIGRLVPDDVAGLVRYTREHAAA